MHAHASTPLLPRGPVSWSRVPTYGFTHGFYMQKLQAGHTLCNNTQKPAQPLTIVYRDGLCCVVTGWHAELYPNLPKLI